MKGEYDNYQLWNPNNRFTKTLDKKYSDEEKEKLLERLEKKAQKLKRNKFDFY